MVLPVFNHHGSATRIAIGEWFYQRSTIMVQQVGLLSVNGSTGAQDECSFHWQL